MVSLCILLIGCNNKTEQPEFDFDENNQDDSDQITKLDSNAVHLIVGTWELQSMGETHAHKAMDGNTVRQAFLKDRTWILSLGTSDSAIVGGGKWAFDEFTQQLSVMSLPDSIYKTSIIKDVDGLILSLETLGGEKQTWRRIKSDPEDSL